MMKARSYDTPQDLGRIHSTDNRPKWFTQMIDVAIDRYAHPPRPHDSEQLARVYMADMFKRRKCDVILCDPLGKVVEHLKFDEKAEQIEHEAAQAERFSEIGTPAIIGSAARPVDEEAAA